MGFRTPAALPPITVGEQAMEAVKGWDNLPPKERGLARAIVAGFAAELELDRELRRAE